MPPTDNPVGGFSTVTSPSGAVPCLFHEADEAGASNAGAGEGSIHGVELHSKDLEADVAWVQIGDIDACVGRANAAGGQVLSEVMEIPDIGRVAVLMDPTGGVFGAITPSA